MISGYLKKLSQYRVDGRDKNLEDDLQNAQLITHDLFQFRFFSFRFFNFKENCNVNELWFFMLYSMLGKYKITQWQHCLVNWQETGHVEMYIVLIKTTSQVT